MFCFAVCKQNKTSATLTEVTKWPEPLSGVSWPMKGQRVPRAPLSRDSAPTSACRHAGKGAKNPNPVCSSAARPRGMVQLVMGLHQEMCKRDQVPKLTEIRFALPRTL